MTRYLYFAYGSNMLTERLSHPSRCPGARSVGRARAAGYRLCFSKVGRDRSGKAMIEPSDVAGASVHGVLFEIEVAEIGALDRVEGVGNGYRREEGFRVLQADTGDLVETTVYFAEETHIDRELVPFDWYRAFALAGAHQHGLPREVIAQLELIDVRGDDNGTRSDEARAVLERAGYAHLLPLPEGA